MEMTRAGNVEKTKTVLNSEPQSQDKPHGVTANNQERTIVF